MKICSDSEYNRRKTSTGLYRSCAALLDISNPLKDLLEFGLVWVGLVGFSLVWLVLFYLVESNIDIMVYPEVKP